MEDDYFEIDILIGIRMDNALLIRIQVDEWLKILSNVFFF